MIRVAIVAASPLARAGLGAMLPATDFETVASVASLAALDSLEDHDADVILLDWPHAGALADMPQGGSDHILPGTPCILIEAEDAAARDGHRSDIPLPVTARGISRFAAVLPRHVSGEQLRAAIRAVAVGLLVAAPDGVPSLSATPASRPGALGPATAGEMPEPLTRRERQVLQMLASGLANKEIAAKLNISDHTAKFHVAAILGKLGEATRTEAVTIAIRHGLVLL